MAPPARTDRLALHQLDADAVAVLVVEAVLDQIDELALALLPGPRWTALRGVERERSSQLERTARVLDTRLGRTVRDLTRFAQTGEGMAPWEVPAAVLTVESVLVGSAGDRFDAAQHWNARPTPSPIDVVVHAASARVAIEHCRGVSAVGFATLAGLSLLEVERELGTMVDATAARDWLVRRRIAGFAPESPSSG